MAILRQHSLCSATYKIALLPKIWTRRIKNPNAFFVGHKLIGSIVLQIISNASFFAEQAHWIWFFSKGTTKGHLNSEWIYEVIISPKMPTKNFSDFCPGGLLEGLLEGRAEIWEFFRWQFERNDDLINSFWI